MSSDDQLTPPSASAAASNEVQVAGSCTPDAPLDEVSVNGYLSEGIGFRTPRDHKIPRSKSCPPAPRKPRLVSLAHKRKLIFEDVAREEVDTFFERSKRPCLRNRSSNATAPATDSTTSRRDGSGS